LHWQLFVYTIAYYYYIIVYIVYYYKPTVLEYLTSVENKAIGLLCKK